MLGWARGASLQTAASLSPWRRSGPRLATRRATLSSRRRRTSRPSSTWSERCGSCPTSRTLAASSSQSSKRRPWAAGGVRGVERRTRRTRRWRRRRLRERRKRRPRRGARRVRGFGRHTARRAPQPSPSARAARKAVCRAEAPTRLVASSTRWRSGRRGSSTASATLSRTGLASAAQPVALGTSSEARTRARAHGRCPRARSSPHTCGRCCTARRATMASTMRSFRSLTRFWGRCASSSASEARSPSTS
mmetsp:Transcript_33109/g.108229  ORF Transcript_33109/g.108229 Transcript_33109/m.108229 type:complete len:249 (-) Transcript_33109:598-1344(-)